MPADQLAVLGEGYVAFKHARAHARRGLIGFLGMFGKLERRAAVSDREVGPSKRSLALPQPVLEWTILHSLAPVERGRSELDRPGGRRLRRAGGGGHGRARR